MRTGSPSWRPVVIWGVLDQAIGCEQQRDKFCSRVVMRIKR